MAVELYDEHEQSERVRKWIREYAFAIVMGVVLAFAGIFGWRQWGAYQESQARLASDYYVAVQQELDAGRLASALEQFRVMQDAVGGRSYTALAGMLVAAELAAAGRLDEAVEIYEEFLDRRRLASLRPVLTLRLARVENARGNFDRAVGLVSGTPPEGFEALWAEARGDFLLDAGRLEEAAQAYRQAIEQIQAEGGNPARVELKLNTASGRVHWSAA